MNTFRLSVNPNAWISGKPGISRSAPSVKPMYQSGWAPAVTGEGSYGPYCQIGLIVATAASRAVTPKTMKKKPPALAR